MLIHKYLEEIDDATHNLCSNFILLTNPVIPNIFFTLDNKFKFPGKKNQIKLYVNRNRYLKWT